MKISFTPKEYSRLIEMCYLVQQMTLASEDRPSLADRYFDVEQKLLGLACSQGCADWVQPFAENEEVWDFSEKIEASPVHDILDNFQDVCFWRDLADQLALRDERREQRQSAAAISALGSEEVPDARVAARSQRYTAEFEKNGLDNVFVLLDSDRLS